MYDTTFLSKFSQLFSQKSYITDVWLSSFTPLNCLHSTEIDIFMIFHLFFQTNTVRWKIVAMEKIVFVPGEFIQF